MKAVYSSYAAAANVKRSIYQAVFRSSEPLLGTRTYQRGAVTIIETAGGVTLLAELQ